MMKFMMRFLQPQQSRNRRVLRKPPTGLRTDGRINYTSNWISLKQDRMAKEELRCLPWHVLIVYLACLLTLCSDVVDSLMLPPVHWNASNPMFKTSNNDHIIQVNMYDELDFVCPQFMREDDYEEYYIVYQVSKREYETCQILPETAAIMIVNCSSPRHRKLYTVLFSPFVSIPKAPEFRNGGTYYYITTSTGDRDGITNVQQGACTYRNMKLTINVCCQSTTTSVPDIMETIQVQSNSTSTVQPTQYITTTEHLDRDPDIDRGETGATTTTVGPTTTPRRIKTTPYKPRSTTEENNIKYTEKESDKTSKPTIKDRNPEENDINKGPDDDGSNNPKQQGHVSGARTLSDSRGTKSSLILSVLLSWLLLLPWLPR